MNQKLDELKEQWRVEKAALELADAQNDIKEVSVTATTYIGCLAAPTTSHNSHWSCLRQRTRNCQPPQLKRGDGQAAAPTIVLFLSHILPESST